MIIFPICHFFLSPFCVSGLCDDSSSSPPNSATQLPSPLSRSASWEGLSALPTQGAPLHHVTRVRPRPPRRHRGALLSSDSVRYEPKYLTHTAAFISHDLFPVESVRVSVATITVREQTSLPERKSTCRI